MDNYGVGSLGGVVLVDPETGLPYRAGPADPGGVVDALIAAGFGAAGQVLATNAGGDGFEWVDLPA